MVFNSSGELFISTLLDGEILKITGIPLSVEDEESLITLTEYNLLQNFPNPFNPTTRIKFQIVEQGNVSLKVYDILGKEVTTLVNEERSAGTYEATFDASELTSGIYFYKLQAGSFVETKKMILLR